MSTPRHTNWPKNQQSTGPIIATMLTAVALNSVMPAAVMDADKDQSADKEVTFPNLKIRDGAEQQDTTDLGRSSGSALGFVYGDFSGDKCTWQQFNRHVP